MMGSRGGSAPRPQMHAREKPCYAGALPTSSHTTSKNMREKGRLETVNVFVFRGKSRDFGTRGGKACHGPMDTVPVHRDRLRCRLCPIPQVDSGTIFSALLKVPKHGVPGNDNVLLMLSTPLRGSKAYMEKPMVSAACMSDVFVVTASGDDV